MRVAGRALPLESGREPTTPLGPELFFALVKPVGTTDEALVDRLRSDLGLYGYSLETIKLSRILADVAEDEGRPVGSQFEDERIMKLIDEGDRLCADMQDAAAVAILGISEIRAIRSDTNQGREVPALHSGAEYPLARTAYLIDSIKRPAEVLQLRNTYGDRVIVIGLLSSSEARTASLTTALRPQRAGLKEAEIAGLAEQLIERDLRESERYGQNTLKAFPLADVFINVDEDPSGAVSRLLKLLFGDSDYQVPTMTEFGMRLAQSTSTLSPELGLKVGAAILDNDGNVISVGTNTHPTPSGTPDFDASLVDIKELLVDSFSRLSGILSDDAARSFKEDPDRFIQNALETTLADSRIRDLTEFQPTVHAEMNALLGALKKGLKLDGSTVYVTAFPCHNCAKHIIAIGRSVCYLEPYAKSRAIAMYGHYVEENFKEFVGIAPRAYDRLFSVDDNRKMADGTRRRWTPDQRRESMAKVDQFISWGNISDREAGALGMLTLVENDTPQPSRPASSGSVVPPEDSKLHDVT